MTVTSGSFLVPVGGGDTLEPWEGWELDTDRLTQLMSGPEQDVPDVDIAIALMDLVRDDLHKSGTGGGEALTDGEMRLAIRALERTCARVGYVFTLPFHDHKSWEAYWIRNDARGSYAARHALLSKLFDEAYAALRGLQDRSLDTTLVEAVSPHATLAWAEVDAEVTELRRKFRVASTPQDYNAIGLVCVRITEALSSKVYDHATHTPEGEDEPKVADTKKRLERYIAHRLSGSASEEVRRFARTAIVLAQAVKHRPSATRTEAGIAADAVIVLVSVLHRLDESQSA